MNVKEEQQRQEATFWHWFKWRWTSGAVYAIAFWVIAYAVYHFLLRG